MSTAAVQLAQRLQRNLCRPRGFTTSPHGKRLGGVTPGSDCELKSHCQTTSKKEKGTQSVGLTFKVVCGLRWSTTSPPWILPHITSGMLYGKLKAWTDLAEEQSKSGGRPVLCSSSALSYTNRLYQHSRGDSSKQPGPVTSSLAGSLEKGLCVSQNAAAAPGKDQALAILCPSQIVKEEETGSCTLTATHQVLRDVELQPNPPGSLGLFPCGCHINIETTLLTNMCSALPDCQPHTVTGLQAC